MPLPSFTFQTSNGWSAPVVSPSTGIHSRAPQPYPYAPGTSSVGPVNAWAQNPATAANLMTTPSTLRDPTLASRGYTSPNTGIRQTAVAQSVYGNVDVPGFLQGAIADLNSEQALRRSLQAEWNNRIFGAASNQNDPNAYLFQEALRAASVSPGAHVNFGAAVQNPLIGQAAATRAGGDAALARSSAAAIARPGEIASRISALQAEQARLGQPQIYPGSRQAAIDNEIQQLYHQQAPAALVASGQPSPSGWAPTY